MKKGLVHIYTGKGKGKTTAAMGMVLRALGYDFNIYIFQFLKNRETGEKNFLEKIDKVNFQRAGFSSKFYVNMNSREKQEMRESIRTAWQEIKQIVSEDKYDIIILDEIFPVISYGIIKIEEVEQMLQEKSKSVELVLTGRGAPSSLKEKADYVTEMKKIKHPFSKNIKARKGIEF